MLRYRFGLFPIAGVEGGLAAARLAIGKINFVAQFLKDVGDREPNTWKGLIYDASNEQRDPLSHDRFIVRLQDLEVEQYNRVNPMTRRLVLSVLTGSIVAGARAWADEVKAALRGVLHTGTQPALAAGNQQVILTGDKATMSVLADDRLKDADFEVRGQQLANGTFQVDPIHTRAMFVHKGGKKLMISYWCEVCSIRTYTPGKCMCCQDETALDLKEKFDE